MPLASKKIRDAFRQLPYVMRCAREWSVETTMDDQHRFRTLDGFRALAILLVIGFHYFVRWTPPDNCTNLYPYGSAFSGFPMFRYGYLGVQIFFIISGFVITMTLFRSRSIGDFARKRFARLFPTMLLCSALTFSFLHLFPHSAFQIPWRNFLPSLTFIDPIIWRKIVGPSVGPIDGVYWSLFVEVKFYFWAAVLFFGLRRRNFFEGVLVGFALLISLTASMYLLHLQHQWLLEFVFAAPYLPWFVSGIGFYALHSTPKSRLGWLLLGESVAALLISSSKSGTLTVNVSALMLGYAMFMAMLYRPAWVRWFASRPIAAVGMASYSLYLLHQEVGVALLQSISRASWLQGNPWLGLLSAGALAALMVGVSLAIYQFWEVPAKVFLLKWKPGSAWAACRRERSTVATTPDT